jgi:hypothetical protein
MSCELTHFGQDTGTVQQVQPINPTNSGSFEAFLPKTGADAKDANISPGYYTHLQLAQDRFP